MKKRQFNFKKFFIISLTIILICFNIFVFRLYLCDFNINEVLRIMPKENDYSYKPIIESRITSETTKENSLYQYLREQIQTYGDLVYLTHLYTNRLWCEFGGIDLPENKDVLFLVLRYIFLEIKEEQPIISEDDAINKAFFEIVNKGYIYALSDSYEEQLLAHRIFHDLDYWKFNNHIGITKDNTLYFDFIEDIPDGSLENNKKRKALYRRINEPK
ncbi:MAG: hypothetical protein ACLFMO_02380 [Eubacteriales bacterium]